MNRVYIFIIVALQYFVNDVRAGPYSCQVPCTPNNTPQHVPDYYWRDYFGVIPEDAVTGGLDKAGNPTYIGQVYTKEFELLPATIYSGCKSTRASAYNKELQSDKNVKILCAKNLDKFAWVVTKNEETQQLLANCHLVMGGSEIGHNLNIGRVNHDGQTIIGKVFSFPLSNRGLWIPDNGHEAHFLTYEILTYNCETQINSCHQCNVAPV